MDKSTSNQLGFNPEKRKLPSVIIVSGTSSGTKTLIATGISRSTALFDVLVRNLDGTNIRNLDVWIGTDNTTAQNNRCQVAIPVNAGNNGSIPLASLASLASQLFVNDIAGNRALFLEDATISIWLENKVTLTAAMYVTPLVGEF